MIARGREARIWVMFLLASLPAACSTPSLPDRYAHCEDLGTLRLLANSADEAEDQMRAQVGIMGGDLLLFNATGRTESGNETPSALTRRRNALAPAESINGRQPELAAFNAGVATAPEELWYYGAALRCRQPTPAQ